MNCATILMVNKDVYILLNLRRIINFVSPIVYFVFISFCIIVQFMYY